MAKKHLLYIHNEKFHDEPHKSALVNELLDKHYGTLAPAKKSPHKSLSTPKSVPKIGGGENIIKTPEQAVAALKSKMKEVVDDVEFCKNGHILAHNGKCLGKGCKYAN